MLVAFGLVVQRGDITCFPNIKVRATSLVLKRHVPSPVEIRNWDMPAKKLVQKLQKVINVTQNSHASAADREEEYLIQEATCVANFFGRTINNIYEHERVYTKLPPVEGSDTTLNLWVHGYNSDRNGITDKKMFAGQGDMVMELAPRPASLADRP
ncbi:hypothetical protein KCU61_g538, partial [Aureobasidium melanogenum]